MKKLLHLHKRRYFWLLLSTICLVLVLIAHYFFQNYLFMPPCEQCVYIRFAFMCIVIGGFLAFLNPKNPILKLAGFVFGFYGCIKGFMYSYKLNLIHKAIASNDPFGLEGCSATPTFAFGLPLDKWMPSWFLPTGDCGYDNPVVPDGAKLDFLQTWLTNLYSDGWYLIPSEHFGNMAQMCMIVFVSIFIFLTFMILSWRIWDKDFN